MMAELSISPQAEPMVLGDLVTKSLSDAAGLASLGILAEGVSRSLRYVGDHDTPAGFLSPSQFRAATPLIEQRTRASARRTVSSRLRRRQTHLEIGSMLARC
jgi:hypothetical protein